MVVKNDLAPTRGTYVASMSLAPAVSTASLG
jgi:hypothetical protein